MNAPGCYRAEGFLQIVAFFGQPVKARHRNIVDVRHHAHGAKSWENYRSLGRRDACSPTLAVSCRSAMLPVGRAGRHDMGAQQ